jgi:hypothetical protein
VTVIAGDRVKFDLKIFGEPAPGVNFINILLKPFLCKSILHSFSLIKVWLCNFFVQNICAKADCKMLMKLITEVIWTKEGEDEPFNNKLTLP